MTTDVLIIGAGPTGLMTANQLNRFDINYIIIDSKSCPTEQSRALAVSARSMELYQQLNLSDKVQSQAKIINGFQIYTDGKRKANVMLNDIGKGFSDFYHFMNTFEQSKNEKLLNDNLEHLGKHVLWNYEFETAKERTDNVEVEIKNLLTLEKQLITAKYVIACDGAKSLIRHLFNFKFEGGTYENKFFVADTEMTWDMGYDKIILAPSDKVFITFFPLQGKNKYRVIGTLPLEFTNKEEIDFKELETVIKNATKFDINFESVGWHSIYKIHHRCVDTFSKGRIFLAGDAAHIHSPAGGQGMNTGLQDGHNLAWKMALVLKGIAKTELLNTYNEERLPFAQTLLNTTDTGFTFLAGDGFWVRNFRKYILLSLIGKLLAIKRVQPFVFKKLSQIDYSYKKYSLAYGNTVQKLKFGKGDRLPRIENGYFNNFKEPIFHLIRISNNTISEKEILEIKNCLPFDIKIIDDKISESWKAFGVSNNLYILVRPDHYILFLADKLDKNVIKQNLENYFVTT